MEEWEEGITEKCTFESLTSEGPSLNPVVAVTPAFFDFPQALARVPIASSQSAYVVLTNWLLE